jgi:hypothetical protein
MLKWIGNQKGIEGIFGIPARDLTDEEVKQHGEKMLLDTGLYEKSAPKREAIPAPEREGE